MGVVMDITPKGDNGLAERLLARDDTLLSITSYVEVLGNSALRNMVGLEVVDLPACTEIEAQAMQGCSHITDIYLRTSAFCDLDNTNALPATTNPIKVHVPSNKILTYQTALNWSTKYNDGEIDIVSL